MRALLAMQCIAICTSMCTNADSDGESDTEVVEHDIPAVIKRCWSPGQFCEAYSFLQTEGCETEGDLCCSFGTTCLPCGWKDCLGGGCPPLEQWDQRCQAVYDAMQLDSPSP